MAPLEFAKCNARAEAVGSQLGALHGGCGLVDFRAAIAVVIVVREGGDLVALGIVAGFSITGFINKILNPSGVMWMRLISNGNLWHDAQLRLRNTTLPACTLAGLGFNSVTLNSFAPSRNAAIERASSRVRFMSGIRPSGRACRG